MDHADHADHADLDERYIPVSGPMFSRGSLSRGELATDLAIRIVAEGGWPALTLRNVALAANVTPQAIAAWFPSVGAMRVAVASRYGDRWLRQLRFRAFTRRRTAAADGGVSALSDLAAAFLPRTWLEEVFDGVWLTIVEAGRWDDAIGEAVVGVHDRERDLTLLAVGA